jgi:hypothetical protein
VELLFVLQVEGLIRPVQELSLYPRANPKEIVLPGPPGKEVLLFDLPRHEQWQESPVVPDLSLRFYKGDGFFRPALPACESSMQTRSPSANDHAFHFDASVSCN